MEEELSECDRRDCVIGGCIASEGMCPNDVPLKPPHTEEPTEERMREAFEEWWNPLKEFGIPKRWHLLASKPSKDVAEMIWREAIRWYRKTREGGK